MTSEAKGQVSASTLGRGHTPQSPSTGLAGMHPAYFGMVMATGIVSIAAHALGMRIVAMALLFANIVFYVVLLALTLLRIARHSDRVAADFMHHGRCVGFFTSVAATCVLGSQMFLIADAWRIAWALWLFGLALWAGLTYTIITILTVKAMKPTLAEGINGGWLLAVVAAQSVAVLGAQLSAGVALERQQPLLFFCLAMWLGGGMLYVWIIALIFYRYTFFPLSPSDLAPPYWINMGAVAISTLAGTMLIANAQRSPVLLEMLPFVKGLTVAFWATATWWIPMLVILGVWRHVYCLFPLKYDPLYWGAVFPLGMYTTCTLRLNEALNLPLLATIAQCFLWIALAAWAAAFLGLARSLLRRRGNFGDQQARVVHPGD